jgi:hypothetical protein
VIDVFDFYLICCRKIEFVVVVLFVYTYRVQNFALATVLFVIRDYVMFLVCIKKRKRLR